MSDWKSAVRRWSAGAALIGIVVGGIGIGTFILFSGDDPAPAPAAPTTPTVSAPRVPPAGEFTVGVKVTDQRCDPAGTCAYTYTIEPRYIGLRPLPEQEVRVAYRVNGGHRPQDGSFTVHGQEARFMRDVTVDGPPGATLTAAVVDVTLSPMFGPTVSPSAPHPAER